MKKGGLKMFIWLGIDVDNQLLEIKKKANIIEKELNFNHSNFTLPFHISLKMSFNLDDSLFEKVLDDVLSIYQAIKPFEVEVKGIENNHTICWIRMKENEKLNEIHDLLNKHFLEKYNIPLHEYDLDYLFHTTLFMDEDENKINQAYLLIKNSSLPKLLRVNKMIIGGSPSGALGTYKVFKEITLDSSKD